MKWLQKPFRSPKVNLNEVEQDDCPGEVQNPLYYFSKYFDVPDFEKWHFLQIYMLFKTIYIILNIQIPKKLENSLLFI